MKGQSYVYAGLICAVTFVTQIACDRQPPRVYDFAASVGQASMREETRWIDFGEPFAREFMLGGWSVDEHTQGVPASITWAVGRSSAIRFYRFRAGDQIVNCHLSENPFVNGPMTIEVVVNGEIVESLVTRDPKERVEFRRYSFVIPARVLRQGMNVMEFRNNGYFRPPPELADQRELAVRWDHLQFGTSLGPTAPEAVHDHLSIAGLTRLDYVLTIPAEARLQWQRIAPWGDEPVPADARLVVTVNWDDGAPPQRIELTPTDFGTTQDVALTQRKGGLGVISFLALLDGSADGNPKGLTITAPRVTNTGVPQQVQPPRD